MVKNFLDWIVTSLLPGFFSLLNQLTIVPGVSLLGFFDWVGLADNCCWCYFV